MEPDKNPAGPESMGEPEKKEVKKPALPVKAVFWLTVVLLVVLAVLVVLMLVRYSSTLAGIFVLVIFLFAFLNKGCWKCPSCGKHLGRFGRPRSCPSCGEKLDI